MTALAFSPVLAFAVSAAAAWFLARTKIPFLPEDSPNARSLHAVPTPRTGGLAILLGLGIAAVVSVGLPQGRAWWTLSATLLVAGTSFADDRRGLLPAVRLALQAIAAAAVVWGGGLSAPRMWLPVLGTFDAGRGAGLLSFLGLLWMANLYNFMDGMDGFAGGMTAIGGTFLGVALFGAGVPGAANLSFALAAAAAGFLTRNWPPARLFMGDCGSVTIGFLFGVLILKGAADGAVDVFVPILIFAPFVVDATLTLFRRLLRGDRVWEAHRSHYYQRLVLAGWSHRQTVLAEYGLMVVCGSAGLLYQRVGEGSRPFVLLAIAALLGGAILAVRHLETSRASGLR